MGEYSNAEYLDRVARSRSFKAKRIEDQLARSLASLKEELITKINQLEGRGYSFASKQKKKTLRAQNSSYDLRRFV